MTAVCTMILLVEGLNCPLPPANPMIPLTVPQFHAVLDEAGWPESLWQEATAVAYCESNLTPGAHRPNAWHFGLFQLNWWQGVNPPQYPGWSDWLREVHDFEGDPLDPVANATAARIIYEHSGWINWQHCGPKQ